MATGRSARAPVSSKGSIRCRKKFLRFFPRGFRDETYIDWERGYKWEAHERWMASLDQRAYQSLLMSGKFDEIARIAVQIESKTNLLFSFEKMALRDALKTPEGAQNFARGLYEYLHGRAEMRKRFEQWREVVGSLPRRQTRVLTWPLLTVFGFIARPDEHMFLKPNVTRSAAREYGFDFDYASRPNWTTYESLLDFTRTVGRDLADLKPRDMIDIQSFLWVQGSSEYD
ncbi:MAG: hypothetical protein QOC81_4733 [Thermoanaerobaculia bacterium]|jgi:hypothetical protein|nr:hypothetical protein [Thermoanaerobaculia bacterium]